VHPDTAIRLAQDHHDELTEGARAAREARSAGYSRPLRRRVPRWRVTWSGITLAAAGASGRPGRSWVIIISATRGA
jgi:hypothetical protein